MEDTSTAINLKPGIAYKQEYFGQHFWVCCECGEPFYLSPRDEPRYCPHCGCEFFGLSQKAPYANDLPFQYSNDKILVEKILQAIDAKDGHCPCVLEQNDDTLCPCKDYRTTGECHCGLYKPFVPDSQKIVQENEGETYEP